MILHYNFKGFALIYSNKIIFKRTCKCPAQVSYYFNLVKIINMFGLKNVADMFLQNLIEFLNML